MLSTAVLCFHTKRKVYQCLLIVLITIQRSLEGDLVKDVLGMERCVLKEMGFVCHVKNPHKVTNLSPVIYMPMYLKCPS
jgi:hypothetical protein